MEFHVKTILWVLFNFLILSTLIYVLFKFLLKKL